jgi:SAM-dependent methyltransferase
VARVARYALLLKANANRVYGASSFALARGELEAFAGALGGVVRRCERTEIAGVEYLVVETTAPLDEPRLAVLANLSSLHAGFEVDDAGRFLPVTIRPRVVLDEDLVTIQRYAGKTNEAFTHLLVNLALAGGEGALARLLAGERLRLLDPVCGRGSSLNRAALYGMDACGVELDERDVDAYRTFITTWLKDKRLKHRVERARLRKGRAEPAHRVTVTYGAGKDPGAHRVIDVVHDDTVRARQHFAPRSMDLLACDLPYGVHHGSRPDPTRLDRGPERLLEVALPEWVELLRPGAGAALAWNRRVLDRTRLCDLASAAGFRVLAPQSEAFVHTVDRSITRDVLLLRRPP